MCALAFGVRTRSPWIVTHDPRVPFRIIPSTTTRCARANPARQTAAGIPELTLSATGRRASGMRRIPFIAAPHSHNHCFSLLKNFDNENFLINVLQPERSIRRAHSAFRAFNVELVHIRSNVSNEDMGRLRVQFFRDALNAIEKSAAAPRLPVLEALTEALSTHQHVPFAPLHALLDAREEDLSYPYFPSLPALESFARRTHGSLARLHMSLLSDPEDDSAAAAAETAGVAVGIAVLLRGAPAAAASRLSYVPRTLATELGVQTNDLLRGGRQAAPVFEAVANVGITRAKEAREMALGLPSRARPALWCIRIAEIYFERLRKAGYDPFDEQLQRSMIATYPLRLQTALLGARIFRKV